MSKLQDIDLSSQVFTAGISKDRVDLSDLPYAAQHREVWKPEPWVPVRPGAEDHLKHGSRRGDTIVAHRLPIAMTGIVEPIGYHRG